jgi:hypothetical protein
MFLPALVSRVARFDTSLFDRDAGVDPETRTRSGKLMLGETTASKRDGPHTTARRITFRAGERRRAAKLTPNVARSSAKSLRKPQGHHLTSSGVQSFSFVVK